MESLEFKLVCIYTVHLSQDDDENVVFGGQLAKDADLICGYALDIRLQSSRPRGSASNIFGFPQLLEGEGSILLPSRKHPVLIAIRLKACFQLPGRATRKLMTSLLASESQS